MAGETPLVQVNHDDQPAPTSGSTIISILMLLCGFTVLFPVSALTVNADLYQDIYGSHKGEQLLFLISLSVTISSPFIQVFVATFQHKISYTSRIITCFLFNTALLVIFPFCLLFLPSSTSFALALLITFVIGVSNSILKMSTISLASYYPSAMTHLLVRGKGYSPVLIVSLKMIVKAIVDHYYPDDKSRAIRGASTIIFILAAAFPLLCAAVYRYARKTSLFSKYYFPSFRQRLILLQAMHDKNALPADIHPSLTQLEPNDEQEQLDLHCREEEEEALLHEMNLTRNETAALLASGSTDFSSLHTGDFNNTNAGLTGADINHLNNDAAYVSLNDPAADIDRPAHPTTMDVINEEIAEMKKIEVQEMAVNKLVVLKKLTLPFSLIVLAMTTTYTIYPAVLIKPQSSIEGLSTAWYRLVLMFIFAISDLAARSLPYTYLTKICPVRNVDFLTYIRLLFMPFFFYSAYVHNIAGQVTFVATFLLGFSNGIIFVMVFRNYQHLLRDSEKPTGGALMSIAVVVGVLIGNVFSLFVDSVAR